MRHCELLEPCASQEACTVLRGGRRSDVAPLPTKREPGGVSSWVTQPTRLRPSQRRRDAMERPKLSMQSHRAGPAGFPALVRFTIFIKASVGLRQNLDYQRGRACLPRQADLCSQASCVTPKNCRLEWIEEKKTEVFENLAGSCCHFCCHLCAVAAIFAAILRCMLPYHSTLCYAC